MGSPAADIWRERIAPRFDDHMGPVFEDIARQALLAGALGEVLGPIDELAPFWSRDGGTEIDWVARGGTNVAFVRESAFLLWDRFEARPSVGRPAD